MKYVHIAGPIAGGDRFRNVGEAMAVAAKLISYGYIVYCPHLCCFLHMIYPLPYETWMELSLAWLAKCDAMIRLPGESPGADREEEYCRRHGIPVFYSVEEFLEWVLQQV